MNSSVVHHSICILVGPPGSGKGSLARRCVQKFGWEHLSTGDLCRQNIAQQTPIGNKIDLLLKSGKLISDSLMLEMVSDWLVGLTKRSKDRGRVVILDGFPRTSMQAKEFIALTRDRSDIDRVLVIELVVPDAVAMQRIATRWVCSNSDCGAIYAQEHTTCAACHAPMVRRSDDSQPDVVGNRMRIYHDHAKSLMESYKQHQLLVHQINAAQPSEQVFFDFCTVIQAELA